MTFCTTATPVQIPEPKMLVVVGGGPAGVSMAMAAEHSGFSVTLIERRAGAIHKPGGIKAVVNPEWAMSKGVVPLEQALKGRNSRHVNASVTHIDLEGKTVVLDDGESILYDYITIAVGAQNMSPAEPPRTATTAEDIEGHYRSVNAAIRTSRSIVVVGGGAVGVEMAGSVRDAVGGKPSITIVHSGSGLADASMPGAAPVAFESFQAQLLQKCKASDIEVRLKTRVTNFRPSDCPGGYLHASEDNGPLQVELSTGDVVFADLLLWCTGTTSNAIGMLPANFTDGHSGLIHVDEHLRINGAQDAFAIGDCNDAPGPKMIIFAGRSKSASNPGHVDIALDNLVDTARGLPPSRAWRAPDPANIISIVPVTKKSGGVTLGPPPNFLAGLKIGAFDYFVDMAWKNAGAKHGRHRVPRNDRVAPRAGASETAS